jgi:hypothetical protein
VIAAVLTRWEIAGLLAATAIIAAALVLAARHPPPTMVTMAMALLSLALLAAWVADPGRADSLVPLIGVGLGALAGALTSLFPHDKDDPT